MTGALAGPFGHPLRNERYAWLGRRAGAASHDYYLFANGEVWCLTTCPSMYCTEWWVPVRGADLGRALDGGRTVRRLADAKAPELADRPPPGDGHHPQSLEPPR